MKSILNETQLKVIKLIGDISTEISKNEQSDKIIGFYWNNKFIVQPFIDVCSGAEVNPIEFYGEDFLNSSFIEIVKNIKEIKERSKNNRKLNETQLEVIKIIGEMQYDIFCDTGSIEGMISFEYDDITIINPFLEYSGVYDVDPIKEYGWYLLKSRFVELVKDF